MLSLSAHDLSMLPNFKIRTLRDTEVRLPVKVTQQDLVLAPVFSSAKEPALATLHRDGRGGKEIVLADPSVPSMESQSGPREAVL